MLFLFPYTTALGPVQSLEEMILSGVTKFIDKVKIPQSGYQSYRKKTSVLKGCPFKNVGYVELFSVSSNSSSSSHH